MSDGFLITTRGTEIRYYVGRKIVQKVNIKIVNTFILSIIIQNIII